MRRCSTFPKRCIEAAECDGVTGWSQFWKIKLPLILPAIGIISILTFVGNFNAFDLVYTVQGALAGPDGSTDILGTLLYRTFFGFQLAARRPLDGRDDRDGDVPHHPRRRLPLSLRHPAAYAPLPVLRRSRSCQKHAHSPIRTGLVHLALIGYTVIALFPGVPDDHQLVQGSATRSSAIPCRLPTPRHFRSVGYQTVLGQGDFALYFQNSFIVTVVSILLVLLFGAMAAFALSEYRFRGNS